MTTPRGRSAAEAARAVGRKKASRKASLRITKRSYRQVEQGEPSRVLQLLIEGHGVLATRLLILPADQVVGEVSTAFPVLRQSAPDEISVLDLEKARGEHLLERTGDVRAGESVAPQGPTHLAKDDAAHVEPLSLGLHGAEKGLDGCCLGKIVPDDRPEKKVRVEPPHPDPPRRTR